MLLKSNIVWSVIRCYNNTKKKKNCDEADHLNFFLFLELSELLFVSVCLCVCVCVCVCVCECVCADLGRRRYGSIDWSELQLAVIFSLDSLQSSLQDGAQLLVRRFVLVAQRFDLFHKPLDLICNTTRDTVTQHKHTFSRNILVYVLFPCL